MAEENNRVGEEIIKEFNQLNKECPSPMGPLISLKLEEEKHYDEGTPKEEIYRDLARIIHRSLVFPFSAISLSYLRSALPRYDSLMPYIEDKGVKEFAKNAREKVQEQIGKLENKF